MKESTLPFDVEASIRLMRMGLIKADENIDPDAVAVISKVHAGLFYDQMHDNHGHNEAIERIKVLLDNAAELDERRILLWISLQYDEMRVALPDVLWWISGSSVVLKPFIEGFTAWLTELCGEGGG